MRFWIALCFCIPLFSLEISLKSGKEEGNNYSILHLRHVSPFSCTSTKDEFNNEQLIECKLSQIPKQQFSPIENHFFTVTGMKTPDGFQIKVIPKNKMKLLPVAFNLSQEKQTHVSTKKNISHWMVLGYSKKPPLLQKPAVKSEFNFPVKMKKNLQYHVGGLDLKGNPIKISRVQDVSDYMEMKKAYQSKDYQKVLRLSQATLDEYPKTAFRNELLLYQIRAYHEMENPEQLIETAKIFLHDYASDSNVAEVLAYIAKAYGSLGQSGDADYYYDRLFDEQPQNPFAAVGKYYKAEQVALSGNIRKSMDLFEEALQTSNDISLASKAAFKLAKMNSERDQMKEAKQYIDKIVSANTDYFKEVKDDAKILSQAFLEKGDPKTAVKITEALLNSIDKKDPERELLLKNLGIQLAKSGKKDNALKRFNEYLQTYKYGQFLDEVRRAKDGLFFKSKDMNATRELETYNDLIERYGDDTVGRTALYKKAQLLFQQKKYKEVLNLEDDLYRLDSSEYPESTQLITKSAIALEKELLKQGKCVEALRLQKMYKIRLLPEWDTSLFECALKLTSYPMAKKIAQNHLKAPSIPERQIWLSRMVKTQFALGEYKEALKGGEELITLLGVEKNPPLNDIYRTMYDAAQRVSDAEGMIRHIKSIEAAYPNDFKDIERYTQMVSLGLKRKDEAMTQTYARKVMALQDRTKTYTQSPFIEFTLAQSYQNVGKDSDALKVLRTLNSRKLLNEKRSRQQYLIGAIEQKLGNKRQAREAFDASIKADKNSAWGKLAKDALALF